MAAKKCNKCGEEKPLEQFYKFKLGRLGRQSECKPCSNARRKAFAATRPDREQEQRREWARNHPPTEAQRAKRVEYRVSRKDFMRGYSAAWYEQNKYRLKEIRKAWYLANKEKQNSRSRETYYANPALWRAHNKRWAQENREKMRQYVAASDAKRRAAKVRSPGQFSAKDIAALYTMQRGKCAVCSDNLVEKFHRDHIVPLAAGGSNDKYNIQLLCQPCNQRKHAKDPIDFMQSRGYLL